MIGSTCARTVRSWTDPHSSTGEGYRWQDEHGRVWQPVVGAYQAKTGETLGQLSRGHICPPPPTRPHSGRGSTPTLPSSSRKPFFDGATPRDRWRRR